MLGPAWPAMRERFDQPLSSLGLLAILSTAGAVVVSLPSGWIRRRIGGGAQLVAGASLFAAAVAAVAASPSWWGVLAATFAIGAGGAAIDAGLNAHVALLHGPRMMYALHGSYGVGATVAPPVVAAAIALGSWRLGFAAAAVVAALVAAAFAVTHARWVVRPDEQPRRASASGDARTLAFLLALFFVGVGVEVAIGSWAYTLLVARGAERGIAAAWVSAYWALFTGGRLFLGVGGRRAGPTRVVTIGSALTLAGCVLLWRDPHGLGSVGLPLAGMGLSGFFPALVTLTPLRLGAERAPAAIGYQVAAGTLGGAALTAAAGLAAQWWGVESLGPFLAASAAAMLALDGVARRA